MILRLLYKIWNTLTTLGERLDAIEAAEKFEDAKLTQLSTTTEALAQAQAAAFANLQAQLDDIKTTLAPEPAATILFDVAYEDGTIQKGANKVDPIRDDQKVTLSINPVDKKGKPAKLDGVPVWASSDETVGAIAPSADGLSADLSGVAPGTGRVTVTGDADLGSGVSPIVGTIDFEVIAGQAVGIDITPGTPQDQ